MTRTATGWVPCAECPSIEMEQIGEPNSCPKIGGSKAIDITCCINRVERLITVTHRRSKTRVPEDGMDSPAPSRQVPSSVRACASLSPHHLLRPPWTKAINPIKQPHARTPPLKPTETFPPPSYILHLLLCCPPHSHSGPNLHHDASLFGKSAGSAGQNFSAPRNSVKYSRLRTLGFSVFYQEDLQCVTYAGPLGERNAIMEVLSLVPQACVCMVMFYSAVGVGCWGG